jgi:predicted nicotinamide N-methyase
MSAIAIPLDGVKARQQKMWASGDYAAVGARIHPMAERPCESADLVAGTRVLDVATGSGNAAIAAARRDCEAIAVDAKRFAVAAHGHTGVTLALSPRPRTPLARTGRLTVAVTATVTDPASDTRRVTATLGVKLARAYRPSKRRS